MTESEERKQHRIDCPHRAPFKGSKKIACRHLDAYCTSKTLCKRMREYDRDVLGIEHKDKRNYTRDILTEADNSLIDLDNINPSEL